MVQATVSSIVANANGSYLVTFGDGSGVEFNSADHLKRFAMEAETEDLAKKLVIGWWMSRNADLSNVKLVEGKTMTLDMSAPALLKVQ